MCFHTNKSHFLSHHSVHSHSSNISSFFGFLTSSTMDQLFLSFHVVIRRLGIQCGEAFIFVIYRKITICFAFWFDRHQGGNISNQVMIILLICFPRMPVFSSHASASVQLSIVSVYELERERERDLKREQGI